ncbi:hypothetical protein SynBIOSU31_02247 [Synechococcus sp. BIOS-U3-1]|nr:hypothetical protein SynBIOSU31_02247 [Synechococcus sp. BIOS-U3-1]
MNPFHLATSGGPARLIRSPRSAKWNAESELEDIRGQSPKI